MKVEKIELKRKQKQKNKIKRIAKKKNKIESKKLKIKELDYLKKEKSSSINKKYI